MELALERLATSDLRGCIGAEHVFDKDELLQRLRERGVRVREAVR